jgi:putative ATP-dependent endonuclease of the OLD family
VIGADGKKEAHYPAAGELITVSPNTTKMKTFEDEFVKVFHGQKTFEYDFALVEKNRSAMLAALKEIHPGIGKDLESVVDAQVGDRAKAKALFKGMFEREQNNVQKGKFAQALAAKIADENLDISVPDYIVAAVKHACQK